ncbi:aldehyde dehydrogenase [Rhodococcus sp. NPDC057014]|uniref:aldehyde dehydrogenase n=1 Tax=Rhodococcus sp. NPDC057014 TaxID=3346000 RepID=UPI0036291BA5
MTATAALVRHAGKFFIGGEWVEPSSDASIDVVDSDTETVFLTVAEAQAADMDRAISAARTAFDEGPWPRFSPDRRAEYLRGFAQALRDRAGDLAEIWPRQSGILQSVATAYLPSEIGNLDSYADLAGTFPFEEQHRPSAGSGFALLRREPVGVVGAILPWNGPLSQMIHKIGPALLAGCTVVVKAPPEAPGETYLIAEIAEELQLPPGVLNIVTADREVSERLVRDPRVDKISFTGSTAVGRRIATVLGERIGRYTLELGGKSAAVILEDADIEAAASNLAAAQCLQTGQVCASLTRVIVPRRLHDAVAEALAANFSAVRVGSPFDPESQMGPLGMSRQRDSVERYIAKGVAEGARLVTGGGRPRHLDRGFYIEPTLFAQVDNSHTIAQEEIFGPVLSVIPADDEADAVRIANDTIYGLNAAVFTQDVDRAQAVACQLRSGTVGVNAFTADFGIAFGGFKQSGVGREGGREGLLPYLEVKTILGGDQAPTGYSLI